jgi:hypothetical protein
MGVSDNHWATYSWVEFMGGPVRYGSEPRTLGVCQMQDAICNMVDESLVRSYRSYSSTPFS